MNKPKDPYPPVVPQGTATVREGSVAATLLARLAEELPARRAELTRAFAARPLDRDAIAAAAHRLAGAAAYCGQTSLQDAAGALESAARANDRDAMTRTWTALARRMDRLVVRSAPAPRPVP